MDHVMIAVQSGQKADCTVRLQLGLYFGIIRIENFTKNAGRA